MLRTNYPQLHAAARRAALNPGARNHAAEASLEAEQLLAWLHQSNLTLPTLSQRDLDRWDVEHGDRAAQVFLRSAQRTGHAPRLQRAPKRISDRPKPISQRHRLAWTQRVLTDDTIALRTRVAAGILLLFAQPITRIVKLTVDDVLQPGQDDRARRSARRLPAPGLPADTGATAARRAAPRAYRRA